MQSVFLDNWTGSRFSHLGIDDRMAHCRQLRDRGNMFFGHTHGGPYQQQLLLSEQQYPSHVRLLLD